MSDRVRLGANWWRLARDKSGAPLYRQVPVPFFPPQVGLDELTEAQFPPEARQPYSFRDLSGGGGQSEIPLTGPNRRYDRVGDAEGEGADTTLTPEGPVVLAPELNTQSPGPAGTDNFLGFLWKGSPNNAYFAMGRQVYAFDGVAFGSIGDLGAGAAASDALLPFRGAQAADTWYAPLGPGATAKYSTDSGGSWTAIGTGGGANQIQSAVVVDGEVVYAGASPRQGNAFVASFDDGGATPTAYGVIDPVGDPAFAITRLLVFANRVFVLKDGEGVFLLTSGRRTLEQEVFPELRGTKLYAFGATVWGGLLWLPTGAGLFAVSPSLELYRVGPERREARTTGGARGLVTAVAGDTQNLYAFRYGGGSTAASWLLKGVTRGAPQEVVFHDLLQLAAGVQCAAMAAVSAGTAGPKLFLDRETAAGGYTLYWLRLPGRGGDPRADPDYRYAAGGTLYYSRLTARFPAVNKSFFGITPLCAPLQLAVDGQTATTAQSLRPRYKLDSTALTGASPFGYTEGALQNTGSGAREEIDARGRGLDVAVRLASSDNTTTPQLHATTPEYDVEPAAVWRHELTLDLTAGSVANAGASGGRDPATPSRALAVLRAIPSTGSVAFVDPWGNHYTVTVPPTGVVPRAGGPREEGTPRDLPLLVDVVAIEQGLLAAGTYGRLTLTTYGALAALGLPYSALATY